MIYEKRNGDNLTTPKTTHKERDIRFLDTHQKNTAEKFCCISKSSTSPYEKPKALHKKRKNPLTRALLYAILLITVIVCFAKKPSFTPFIKSMADNFSLIFEKDTGFIFSPEFSPVEARTLYTVEYRQDSTNQASLAQESDDSTPSQTTSDNHAASVSTNLTDTGLYSDGTKYLPITELDLSGEVLVLSNETSFSPDTKALIQKTPAALENLKITNDPLVLIIHTHAGESYTEHDSVYPEGEPFRDYEGDNIVQIGREVKNTLSDFGINCIHSEKMHDKESFINAYSNSAKTVKEYLQKYPSIRFVIDIHRDAIIRDDGESIKPVVEIAGQKYAQLMFVMGTNQKGHNHPLWQENLSLALNLMQKADEYYPGLFRSINLRDVPFNQQLCDGYLLLEVGSCANLKEEALLSAHAFGQSLAALIYDA